jgi:hypothetical protein
MAAWHDRRVLHLVLYGLLAIILAAALFLIATRFLPAGEQIAPPLRDEPPWELPGERAMRPEDVDSVRLPVALRGYRFAETDILLDRLAGELRDRDAEIARLRERLPDEVAAAPRFPVTFEMERFGRPEQVAPAVDVAQPEAPGVAAAEPPGVAAAEPPVVPEPQAEAPGAAEPQTEPPVVVEPQAEAPGAAEPQAGPPVVEPQVEPPVVVEPQAEAQVVNEPEAGAPVPAEPEAYAPSGAEPDAQISGEPNREFPQSGEEGPAAAEEPGVTGSSDGAPRTRKRQRRRRTRAGSAPSADGDA